MTERAQKSPPTQVIDSEILAYSVKGACRALGGMSSRTFYRRVKEGHFHILHDGGRALIDAAEVQAYVASLKSQALANRAGQS